MKKLMAIVLGLLLATAVHAADGSWNVDAGGAWSNANNWVGGIIASGDTYTAYFTNTLTAARTVTNNWTNMFLGNIVISNANFTLTGAPIYFTNGTSPSVLSIQAGGTASPTFSCGAAGSGVLNITGTNGIAWNLRVSGNWSNFHGTVSNLLAGTTTTKVAFNITPPVLIQPDVTWVNGPASTVYMTQGTFSNQFVLNGNGNLENLGSIRADGGTISGMITCNSNASIGVNSGAGTVFLGIITNNGTSINLTRAGAGTVILRTNVYVNLITNASSGVLRFDTLTATGSNAAPDGTGMVPLYFTRGTIQYNFAGTYTNTAIRKFDSAVNVTLNLTNNAVQYLTNDLLGVNPRIFNIASTATQYINGVISGAGAVTLMNTGVLVLANTNTHTGTTTISMGTLVIGNTLAVRNSIVTNAATLRFSGITNAVFGGLRGTEAFALTNNLGQAIALTVGGNNSTNTYAGTISGAGSLIKTGSGIFTLGTNNTYTGSTTISNGTLQVNSTNSFAKSTVLYISLGATNDLNFTGTNDITSLYLNGVMQPSGTYGTNNVMYTNIAYFTGNGIILNGTLIVSARSLFIPDYLNNLNYQNIISPQ